MPKTRNTRQVVEAQSDDDSTSDKELSNDESTDEEDTPIVTKQKRHCSKCHAYANPLGVKLSDLSHNNRKKYSHKCKKRCKSYDTCPTQ